MLRVFEAFSGVGAQRMALRNLGVNFEIVATCEINVEAILAYYYIHCKNKKVKSTLSKDEIIKYLNTIGVGTNRRLEKLTDSEIFCVYNACIISKNLGDIHKINLEDIPEHDLFTYSFPCQDISSVGTKKGLDEGSGTRSSLLWECKKIIEAKKPKYLMLENVKNLTTGKNKANFEEWLKYLEKQGYENYWNIFDSQEYGIPQRRPRVIVISKLRQK